MTISQNQTFVKQQSTAGGKMNHKKTHMLVGSMFPNA